MRKILTIADREYRAMVGTRAFLISVTMMPLLMFGGIFAMEMLKNTGEIKDQRIVVIDHSGKFFAPLKMASDQRNRTLDSLREKIADDASHDAGPDGESGEAVANAPETGPTDPAAAGSGESADFGKFTRANRFLLERWDQDQVTDEQLWQLSEQVRNQDLYAFVEIPADIVDAPLPTDIDDLGSWPTIRFYSEDSAFSEARAWLDQVLNAQIRAMRLRSANVDPELVAQASLPVPVRGFGLLEKQTGGSIQDAAEKNELLTIFLPLGVMMLMFMVIFMASQPMLESVLEEKSQRIAEVLLGSANPYQLMTGKLLGTVCGSLTILLIYFLGGWFLASYRGWTEFVPVDMLPWFLGFQVCGVLFFASIFMAVGASVTQLKEAQSMLMPVWLVMMSPLFIWFMVIREPNGPMATWFSFFPPATPTMMMLRMSTDATIPVWQPVVGLLLLVLATAISVYIAARIFRVGLLWQGKTPRLGELVRWAFRG